MYRVSLRSNGVIDVSKVAKFLGGGGHVRASGCTINGTFHDAINSITKYIQQQYDDMK
jgi:phosphoesterase RecJ-like protein